MPIIFLSPSTQENEYVTGGNEEYYMNLIANAMVPYLRANSIDFARSNPGASIDEIIEQSNKRIYDLYLALRSGTSPQGAEPPLRGLNVYHYAYTPVGGERAARYISIKFSAI
jgi:N-acetylmuramoyl-L-alanine amidase